MYIAQLLTAPRTRNGNSRQGYLIYSDRGYKVDFVHGYNLKRQVKESLGDRVVFLDYDAKITGTEWRQLKKEFA
mgnify:CR=1 FL=1